jgi:RecF/RecN/SMC N terminal domain
MMPRLESLTIRGFRAFGSVEQTLKIPGNLAVVWGPNSCGKTSLAEALEFLLTGGIVRRELLGSSQDEFADALRNVHLDPSEEVFVAAEMTASDGARHAVKRTLTRDFGKRQDCESTLMIDGMSASQDDLVALGIVLSQPPLSAPVLAQHTMSYIFSIGPQNRATYFKTLLEATDLDDFRNEVVLATSDFAPAADGIVAKLVACSAIEEVESALGDVRSDVPTFSALESKLDAAACALVEAVGDNPPAGLGDKLAVLDRTLSGRRSQAFAVEKLGRIQMPAWSPPADDTWKSLEAYVENREAVEQDTVRLSALYEAALGILDHEHLTAPIDCPLCGTESALTSERVAVIREQVESTTEFRAAESIAGESLRSLATTAAALDAAVDTVRPDFMRMTAPARHATGFTTWRLRKLLDDRSEDLIAPWIAQVRRLMVSSTELRLHIANTELPVGLDRIKTRADVDILRAWFGKLSRLREQLVAAIDAYAAPAEALLAALNAVLDVHSETVGWQEFIDIARQPERLRDALVASKARDVVNQEIATALAQIDRGKEEVLNDKFAAYSGDIQAWWERLRPDEATYFAALKPREKAKRTIDFKAALSCNGERAAPKVRDVIAVFSQSQLHCLGLALFLARAQREGQGFILLDDPVLSSDEDYRVHFNSAVLTALIDLPLQVIVLTQDNGVWRDLESLYRHRGVLTAQLYIENAAEGTVIENTSESLVAKINRADSLSRGGHPDSRKECGIQLRDAGECFCKEMLIADCSGRGKAATLADYGGKTLEWLCPRVDPLLIQDPAHQGKFEVFRRTVNSACHDNAPPGSAEMKQAVGELRRLVKDYLGR